MKILVISQYFWPEGFRINEIAASMLAKGVELEILTGKPNYPSGKIFDGYRASGCQQEIWQGIKISRIPLLVRGKGALRLALNYISFVVSGVLFGPWLLRGKKFDAIFVPAPSPILQALPAIFLGWLHKCSVVLWVQDLWPDSLSATGYVKNRFVLNLVANIVRYIYRHCDLILVSSRAFENPINSLALDVPVVYYPNSVDDTFTKPVIEKIPFVPGLDSGFSVLFAGNIGSAQAVGVIVEAAAQLTEYTDINFVILGDGSSREEMLLKARLRNLKNIHFPGRFPAVMMPSLMQKASVLLVTLANHPLFSLTVPNKVQAYMAAGKPIIACLNGEGARLVDEARAGVTVPAENSTGLADAILRLYKLPPVELNMMGSNGREYYREHYDHGRLVDRLIEHLKMASKAGEVNQ